MGTDGYRLVSSVFTVPSWEAVKEHPDDGDRWAAGSGPEIAAKVEAARRSGKFLTAHLTTSKGIVRPYCMTATKGTAFFYPLKADEIQVDGHPDLIERYCHYADPPPNPENFYSVEEEEAEGMDELFHFSSGRWLLKTTAPGSPSIIHVGSPYEPINAVLLRVSVILQIFDAIDTMRQPSAMLPYHQDTPRIGLQRMAHVQRWQFENAPTQPLFA